MNLESLPTSKSVIENTGFTVPALAMGVVLRGLSFGIWAVKKHEKEV